MIEFIEGLVVGMFVTLVVTISLLWAETIKKPIPSQTPQTRTFRCLAGIPEYQKQSTRLELGESPTKNSKNI